MLVLVASPIGNLGDLAPRASEVLTKADYWIVEDSRVSSRLATHLGVKKPMRVLNDHTNERSVTDMVKEVEKADLVVLLTDGGCPVISDPGAQFCDLVRQAGVEVDALPGPSAVTNALMLSGFYAQRFVFLGFLARKDSAMAEEFAPYTDSTYTLVAFESPHRILSFLKVAHRILGERRYAVCREMTKMHQQVYRNFLGTYPNEVELPIKGEVTVVIEGLRKRSVHL